VLAIFHHWLPADIWMGFGSLSASWTGGSANMIAVKEANGTPDRIYSLMVVADTICPYVWMGLLILLSGFQARYDKWNRSRHAIVDELQKNHVAQAAPQPLSLGMLGILLALAAGTTCASVTLGEKLPTIKGVVNPYAWSIILATGIGLAMSFTPARRLEPFGASRVGYAMLYLVLASIGAKTSLADFELHSVLVLLLAGFVWIGIHAVFIVVAGRLLRAPMSLLAAASQANIGGTASAPVVAAVYHPALATVGLLLAVLGNIIGTYLGLVCTQLCHWVSRLW
jgi:uncharacterized membrane protein